MDEWFGEGMSHRQYLCNGMEELKLFSPLFQVFKADCACMVSSQYMLNFYFLSVDHITWAMTVMKLSLPWEKNRPFISSVDVNFCCVMQNHTFFRVCSLSVRHSKHCKKLMVLLSKHLIHTIHLTARVGQKSICIQL